MLRERLQAARAAAATEDVGGYDERRLIKIRLADKVQPEDVARAAGNVRVVSQEEDTLLLAFASDEQLAAFEARLTSLAIGERVSYRQVLYALQDLDRWSRDDRIGWALKRDGFSDQEPFVVDAELWPLERGDEARRLRGAFERWVAERGGEILDAVRQPHLTLHRISCGRALAEDLLRHRDVRSLDLPARIGLEQALVFADVHRLETTPGPPGGAPGIAVLDSGIVAGHPLLASAVGDTQSFVRDAPAADEHGHGTFVAGIALYDDVAEGLRQGRFVPALRLFSGRILNERNEGDVELIENQIERAVRYFVDNYDCRIFNLSYGDLNKPYQGRHVAGLAVTLDALSRELDVLFIVATGNYRGDDDGPGDWRAEYPHYLTSAGASLLDPAPALNAVTVGSIARHERNERWPEDPGYLPVARTGRPSPFTRHGPSVNGAIKPDLVDYGGNVTVHARVGGLTLTRQGVGELSISRDFATARPFAEDSGTSFAAPRVANAAARILAEHPDASADLCRAMLVAHARTPGACADLFGDDTEALRNVTGYGQVDRSALYRSLEDSVTLWTEESIENRRHHFYEIPLPDEFWEGSSRSREVTVALAFRPAVRTTRIDYRAAFISFKFVRAASLDEVANWFNAEVPRGDATRIPEYASGRGLSETIRSKGTVQASTWTFKTASETRRDGSWGRDLKRIHHCGLAHTTRLYVSSVTTGARLDRVQQALGSLSENLECVRHLMEAGDYAWDYARLESAAEHLDEVGAQFDHGQRFTDGMKIELVAARSDVKWLRRKFGHLAAREIRSAQDARLALSDINLFVMSSLFDIRADALRLHLMRCPRLVFA